MKRDVDFKIPINWDITEEQLLEMYLVEKELSNKIRFEEIIEKRRSLYSPVYTEYFSRLPFHPQITIENNPISKTNKIAFQSNVIVKFLQSKDTFIEVGAGDCELSKHIANFCKRAIAFDVTENLIHATSEQTNFTFQHFDGFNLPFDTNSVDIAFSNQVLEHLHPNDALFQTKNILNTLKKNGKYICITPNRLMGPHDVSRYFGLDFVGFHLQEYTSAELKKFLLQAGFRFVHFYTIIKNKKIRIPFFIINCMEYLFSKVSMKKREFLLSKRIISIIFEPIVVAIK